MARQAKKRRVETQPNAIVGKEGIECLDSSYSRASKFERDTWNGFCELESEPALFNVMLREFGVTGVKIQEVVSLDEEMMAFLK
ncbi:hypothetical protein AbraIFM66950_006084 [Aspergillus brasiliensis]|nr:hypothetical protein AbraIFM66950_006084 [Aspergillus brasiliensis]